MAEDDGYAGGSVEFIVEVCGAVLEEWHGEG